MRVVTAPNHVFVRKSEVSVFLAGGITGCPDWQSDFIYEFNAQVEGPPFLLLNPRRRDFDINEKDIGQQQIEWEFDCLNKADVVVFWFCAETLNPIVLYELGYRLGRNSSLEGAVFSQPQTLLIGIHPEYQRMDDVLIQSRLASQNSKHFFSISDLVSAAVDEAIHRSNRSNRAENELLFDDEV